MRLQDELRRARGLFLGLTFYEAFEHAVVLVLPAAERKLTIFKERFDDLDTGRPTDVRPTHDAAVATAAAQCASLVTS